MSNICIFGDSIAWGGYDLVNGGWANQLVNYFRNQENDTDVYNLSICANTTAGLLKHFKVEATARNPQIIIFAIGINDASYHNLAKRERVTPIEFKNNLVKLISEARKFTSKIIFIGLTRVDEKNTNPVSWEDISYLNSKIEQYDNTIKQICAKEKLPYIDVAKLVTKKDLEDSLHPNAAGHQKMYKKIKTFLIK